jgi:hypothetical protein
MNNILRLLGISLLGLVLAACNLQPATPATSSEPEIDTQANVFKQFGDYVSAYPVESYTNISIATNHQNYPVVAFGGNLIAGFFIRSWDGNSWSNTQISRPSNIYSISMILDASDNPVVSWDAAGGDVWVKYGSSFTQLDIVPGNQANTPSIALDAAGNPWVTWKESDNIYVKKWNGSQWVLVGTGPLNVTAARQPTLVFTQLSEPTVAWIEANGSNQELHMLRWDGSQWGNITGFVPLNLGTNSNVTYSLALNMSGQPVVAWPQDSNPDPAITTYGLYVKRWTGSQWLSFGSDTPLNIDLAQNVYATPSLKLQGNNPYVTWSEQTNSGAPNIYLKRWTGTIWQQIGTAWDVVPSKFAQQPSLALDSFNNPMVAWVEDSDTTLTEPSDNIYVKGYIKNVFAPFGNALDFTVSNDASNPSISLDNAAQPVVAWVEQGSSSDVLVKRWNKALNTWLPALTPPDNVLNNNVYSPSLAVEKSTNVNAFNPVVAWEEDNGSNRDIYVKRWNGTAWTNYGTGTPLDKSAANSATQPSLVLDSTNRPYVAWTERVGTTNNIYVKRWTGTAWAFVGGSTGLDFSLSNEAIFPSLAIGSDNKPVVAWAEENTTTFNANIYVKRLVGNTWTLVGTTAIDRSLANYATSPSLDLDSSNNPIVTWEEQLASGDSNIYAKRWNSVSGSWVSLGNILDKVSSHPTSFPTLAIGTNNNPVVSWTEFDLPGSDSYNVYVKRWTGTAWQSVSTGAVDVNLANNAYSPSMVLNAANNPVVAWQESIGPSELNNIYVKGF